MPNISSHMVIAKKVSDYLNIKDEEFFKGNLLPDLYDDKNKSHYKIQGNIYLIPNVDYVKKNLDFKNTINLGILTHLLLDKYYFEDYLPNKYNYNIIDNDKSIYNDYDILNKEIVEYFKLDTDYLKKILKDYVQDINKEKLDFNIKCLNIKKEGTTKYLEKNDFLNFLENISKKITKDIREVIKTN